MKINYDKLVREWSERMNDRAPIYTNRYHRTVLRGVMKDFGYPLWLLGEGAGMKVGAWRDMIHKGVASKFGKLVRKQANNTSWVMDDVDWASSDVQKNFKKIKTNIETYNDVSDVKYINGTSGSPAGKLPKDMGAQSGVSGTQPMMLVQKEDTKKWYAFKLTRGGSAKGKVGAVKGQDYEMGIVVEMNKYNNKGMTDEDACKLGKVPWKDYQNVMATVGPAGYKIVRNSKMPPKDDMTWFGAGSADSNHYTGGNKTPKTDLYSSKYFISLKKKGGSQLMSGTAADSIGVLSSAEKFMMAHEGSQASQVLKKIIDKIEANFARNKKTPHTVRKIQKTLKEAWIPHRVAELEKISKVKDGYKDKRGKEKDFSKKQLERHAQAEGILLNIFDRDGNWEYKDKNNTGWFLVNEKGKQVVTGRDKVTLAEFKKWLKSSVTYANNKILKDEALFFIDQAIDHKEIEAELLDYWYNSDPFKKWCCYEAATGNYKYTGTTDKIQANNAQANSLLVFTADGGIEKWKDDMLAYADAEKSKVKPNVGFKTSKTSKNSSVRLLIGEVVEKELILLNERIDAEFDEYTELLEEGIKDLWKQTKSGISKMVKKIESIAKKIWDWLGKLIESFYENVIKTTIKKLEEWGKEGIDVLTSNLGLEPLTSNSAEVNISF